MIVCVQLSVGGINFPFTLAREFNVIIINFINAHAATCTPIKALLVQYYYSWYSKDWLHVWVNYYHQNSIAFILAGGHPLIFFTLLSWRYQWSPHKFSLWIWVLWACIGLKWPFFFQGSWYCPYRKITVNIQGLGTLISVSVSSLNALLKLMPMEARGTWHCTSDININEYTKPLAYQCHAPPIATRERVGIWQLILAVQWLSCTL